MNFDIFYGPQGKLCVKPKNNARYDYQLFLEDLSQCGHLPKGVGAVVIDFLGDFIAKAIGNGASVTIDGLGTFSPSLTFNKESDNNEINGNSVALSRIAFRPHPNLKNKAQQNMRFTKVRSSAKLPRTVPPVDQRKELLLKLLKKQPLISAADYQRATGLSHSRAYSELADFVAAGIIVAYTAGRNKMYALKPTDNAQ